MPPQDVEHLSFHFIGVCVHLFTLQKRYSCSWTLQNSEEIAGVQQKESAAQICFLCLLHMVKLAISLRYIHNVIVCSKRMTGFACLQRCEWTFRGEQQHSGLVLILVKSVQSVRTVNDLELMGKTSLAFQE